MHYLINKPHKTVVFAVVFTFLFLCAAQNLMAQKTPGKYKAGDKIDMGKGITYEIVECRIKPNTGEEECDFIAFFPDGTRSNLNSSLAFILRRDELAVKAEKKRLDAMNGGGKTLKQTKPTTDETTEETETETDEPEITVTAQKLYSDYNNNDETAKRKYVGKLVRVTGVNIYNISQTKFSARFNKTYSGSTIQCILEDIEQIQMLNKNETVTIIGTPRGSMTSTGVIFEPCCVEGKTAAQTTKTTVQTVKTTTKSIGNVAGTWYYTAIINADGTEQKLSNSESYLWLKDDGSYENRFGSVGQIGTYAANGSRLTLNRENVSAKTYTLTINGTTMTLKSGAGSYKLKKE